MADKGLVCIVNGSQFLLPFLCFFASETELRNKGWIKRLSTSLDFSPELAFLIRKLGKDDENGTKNSNVFR